MNFARTLIIKPSSMGDIVQALPVLTALKESHPEAHATWLVSRPFVDLLEGHPRLDEMVVFDRHEFGRIGRSARATAVFIAFLEALRRRRFTTVLDLQGLFRSGFLAAATGAPSRVGFMEAREMAPLFYTDRVTAPPETMHAVDRYLALARHVGLASPRATDHLPVAPEDRAAVRARLAAEGVAADEPLLVVSAHARWETKQWPPERFAEVLDRLAGDARAVLVGSAAAVAVGRQVAQTAKVRPVDLTNRTTLKELVALIAAARVLVTNDSGPMHVAAAVGTPVVAIFGPTHPGRTGPRGEGHRVLAERAPCSPCYERRCLYAGGPQALCCLKNISADEVARHVREIWNWKG